MGVRGARLPRVLPYRHGYKALGCEGAGYNGRKSCKGAVYEQARISAREPWRLVGGFARRGCTGGSSTASRRRSERRSGDATLDSRRELAGASVAAIGRRSGGGGRRDGVRRGVP